MSETDKRDFEPGRLLLLATLLMSITLVSLLYVISESLDLSNGIQLNSIEICLAASYMLTSLSMVIVINEFFQVKTKARALIAFCNSLENSVGPQTISNVSQQGIDAPISKLEIQKISEKELDEDLEFEKLLEAGLSEENTNEETVQVAPPKSRSRKVKVDEEPELQPLIEDVELHKVFDELEYDEAEMNRMLAESEVLATLAELEELVEELKLKKAPLIAQ